ncbi:unnamed protein product [Blepharisma stoltei]|uniref:Phosphatidic acid phosphatase type 2/haloperoxidase domain-containing protein n=1 Tax=Blepharisma stoltei TaxID=1481888 RepID=A0AAU9JJX2_9CILI|nr:unnamed protein product [Blepharisma stoltei]
MITILKKQEMMSICGIKRAIHSFDQKFCSIVNRHTQAWGVFQYIMALFASAFNNKQALLLWGCVLWYLPLNPASIFACVGLPALTLILTLISKKVISRPRPEACSKRTEILKYNLRGIEKNHSMPSGDSAQAALFWSFLHLNFEFPLWVCFIMTVSTMFSRIYYMCHFPSDTIIGAILGTSLAIIYTNHIMI